MVGRVGVRVGRLWSVFCHRLRSARLVVLALLDAYADMAETGGAGSGVVGRLDVISASGLDLAASPLSPRSVQQARDARDWLFGTFGAKAEDTRPLSPSPDPVAPASPEPPEPPESLAHPLSPLWYPPPPAAPQHGAYYPVGGGNRVDAALVVEGRLGAVDDVLWLRLIYATPLCGAALN